jgi:CheY-like chemotaxis protein
MGQASVLLVEDEALIRMMLVDMIEELGHRVVAEAGSVVEGKSLAEIAKFDIAVLDINIAGLSIQPVAETIAARGLPFFFVSGYRSGGIPDRFRGTPLVPKPVEFARLNETIRSVLSVSGDP